MGTQMLQVRAHLCSDCVHITESLLWLGTLRELTVAKDYLQRPFLTPQRLPSGFFTGDNFDTAPSSPIVEGGSFWDLSIGDAQDESQSDFVRTCIAGPSSPADSQRSEESFQSPDRGRSASPQQGTDTFLVLFYGLSKILNKQLTCTNLDVMNLSTHQLPKQMWAIRGRSPTVESTP